MQVPYVERAYLPGLHLRHTKKLGGRTVPAFVPDDGSTALVDSTEILQWADAQAPAERRLYPAEAAARAEADAIEEELDTGLGPATRLWAYAHGLRDRPLLRAMVAPSFPRWRDRALLALALPAIGPLIAKQYGARPEAVAGAEAAIEDGFARISARLERQPYLGGRALRRGRPDVRHARRRAGAAAREPLHAARRAAAATHARLRRPHARHESGAARGPLLRRTPPLALRPQLRGSSRRTSSLPRSRAGARSLGRPSGCCGRRDLPPELRPRLR